MLSIILSVLVIIVIVFIAWNIMEHFEVDYPITARLIAGEIIVFGIISSIAILMNMNGGI